MDEWPGLEKARLLSEVAYGRVHQNESMKEENWDKWRRFVHVDFKGDERLDILFKAILVRLKSKESSTGTRHRVGMFQWQESNVDSIPAHPQFYFIDKDVEKYILYIYGDGKLFEYDITSNAAVPLRGNEMYTNVRRLHELLQNPLGDLNPRYGLSLYSFVSEHFLDIPLAVREYLKAHYDQLIALKRKENGLGGAEGVKLKQTLNTCNVFMTYFITPMFTLHPKICMPPLIPHPELRSVEHTTQRLKKFRVNSTDPSNDLRSATPDLEHVLRELENTPNTYPNMSLDGERHGRGQIRAGILDASRKHLMDFAKSHLMAALKG